MNARCVATRLLNTSTQVSRIPVHRQRRSRVAGGSLRGCWSAHRPRDAANTTSFAASLPPTVHRSTAKPADRCTHNATSSPGVHWAPEKRAYPRLTSAAYSRAIPSLVKTTQIRRRRTACMTRAAPAASSTADAVSRPDKHIAQLTTLCQSPPSQTRIAQRVASVRSTGTPSRAVASRVQHFHSIADARRGLRCHAARPHL